MWWTYPRGGLHYDVMVTLILLFLFVTPYFISYNDKPIERTPHPTGVVVHPDGNGLLVYELPAEAVAAGDDLAVRAGLLRVIEPLAGEVDLVYYQTVKDNRGRVIGYKAWVKR